MEESFSTRRRRKARSSRLYSLSVVLVMLRWARLAQSWQTTTTTVRRGSLDRRISSYVRMCRLQQNPCHHPPPLQSPSRISQCRYSHKSGALYSSSSDDTRSNSLPPELSMFGSDDDPESSGGGDAFLDEVFGLQEEMSNGRDADQQQVLTEKIQERKLDHLLDGLNPSQVEAVTQNVVDLRYSNNHDDDDALASMGIHNDDNATGNNDGDGAVITRVIAGPGSGKTKVLTTRIAYLLQQEASQSSSSFYNNNGGVGNVLAVTFTRKAAGEMRERLERLLREVQDIEDQISEEMKDAQGDDDDSIRLDRHGNIIQEFPVSSNPEDAVAPPKGLERVELGTFHSICAKIMRYNGELLKDLPSVHRDMSKASPIYIEQEDADDEDEAGASSPLEKVLLEKPEINLNGQFVIADQSEQLRILKECMNEQDLDLKSTSIKPINILNIISDMKEKFAQGQDPFQQEKGKPPGTALKMARQVYYRYREKLLSNNAVDFDDLILMTRELLMENQELRQRLHKRWPHVLVDEFQDTSKTQLDLVKLLTSSTLFVVGDADQSIYSWRGAHVGSLNDVKKDFSEFGDVHTVFLKENYRSTSNIVRAAERVISSNADGKKNDDLRQSMKPKRGGGKNPRIISCEDEAAEANFVVDTILSMIKSGEFGSKDTVAIVYRTNSQSRHLEEACVAKNLPYVIRGGAGGFYNRAEIKDCLCFLRWIHNGNDEGSMLRAMKTPSKGIGAKALSEFQDFCERVQAYSRRSDINGQRPSPLDILISMSDENNDEETAPRAEDYISKRAVKSFLAFSTKMRDIRAKAYETSVDELLFHIIEELDLMEHFNTMSKTKSEFEDRKGNVQELRQAAKKYATIGTAMSDAPQQEASFAGESALSNFLDDVALVSDMADAEEKNENRLVANLMTIHASKGTEFDGVFVVGLEEGTLPCTPALSDDATSVQLEEERRLCYVAMTRAKTHLILSWRKEVTVFGDWSSSGPKTVEKKRSRFLEALVAKKKKTNGTTKPKETADKTTSKAKAREAPRKRVPRHGLKGPLQQDRRHLSVAAPATKNGTMGATPRKKQVVARTIPEANGLSHAPPTRQPVRVKHQVSPDTPKRKTATRKSESKPQSGDSGSPPPSFLDPTWFFPVGEAVLHKNLGPGVVMGHTPAEQPDETKVQVKFENGKVLEFPALGSDIVPDL